MSRYEDNFSLPLFKNLCSFNTMHRRDGIIDNPSRDRLKRINLFLDEFKNLHDVSLFVNNMLAEGKSIFNGHAAACWLTDETGVLPQYRFDPDGLWPELAEHMKLFDTEANYQSATIFNYSDLSRASAKVTINSEDQTPELIILYNLPKLQNYTGHLLFYSCLENLDKRVVEEGALLANLTELVLQSSLLSETVLTQSSEMGLFYETTAALSIEFETPQLLETTLKRALNLLDGDFGYIFTASENQNDPILHLAVSHKPGQPEKFLNTAILAAKESLKNENPLTVTYPPELITIPLPDGKDSQDQSSPILAMAAPILWSEELLGTLVILSSLPENTQTRHDMGQLQLVSFQIANAFGVTKLIEAEREQRRFIEALQTASVAIGRQIHLDEVLDKILEQALHAFNCDAANIMVIDGGKARIERARGYDVFGLDTEVIENFALKINEHNNLLLMSEGEALHVADTKACEDWIPHKGFNWCQSWAGGPIFYGGTLLGFLNLDSAKPHSFSDEILGQLQAFATHAGIALHKARLLKRLTEEHTRLQKIYNVGRDISSSLDPEKILHELLRACFEVLRGVYGVIFSINQDTGTVSLMRKENPHKLQNLHELYLVELLAKRIYQNQEPDCDYIAYTDSSYWLLGLPLRTAQSTLGIVMIWIPSASDFEQAWMDALANLGQHAALALTKAEKHLELQRRLNELTILQHVSGVIASQLDIDAVLIELTEQLHTKLGFNTTQVFVREKDQLILRQYSGPPPPLSALNLSQGIIGRVARTGIPELIPNVKLEPQYLSVFAETTSEIAVPISHENKVIGILNVESSDPALLDEGSMELLLLLADQISIALQNAELNEQIRDTVENLESRVQARTAVLEAVAVQAQDAERAKAQFVADVSHELRTPLTNIGLYLDLLENGPDSRYHEYFQTMRRETERLGGLIEQLLTISRLDSDQFELQFKEVNVNNLLLSLANDRKMMARKKGLVLDLEIDDNLPIVQADPQYLNQVMTNLLTNAMNYTPEGGRILIRSELCADQDIPGVCFAIEDTGPGIPLSEQAKIFSRFYRGSAGKNSGVSGTGLGLSISREIIIQHRGTINVVSVKDQGTTFTVWIPISDASNNLQA